MIKLKTKYQEMKKQHKHFIAEIEALKKELREIKEEK